MKRDRYRLRARTLTSSPRLSKESIYVFLRLLDSKQVASKAQPSTFIANEKSD